MDWMMLKISSNLDDAKILRETSGQRGPRPLPPRAPPSAPQPPAAQPTHGPGPGPFPAAAGACAWPGQFRRRPRSAPFLAALPGSREAAPVAPLRTAGPDGRQPTTPWARGKRGAGGRGPLPAVLCALLGADGRGAAGRAWRSGEGAAGAGAAPLWRLRGRRGCPLQPRSRVVLLRGPPLLAAGRGKASAGSGRCRPEGLLRPRTGKAAPGKGPV